LSHITEEHGEREIFFSYDVCPQGTYINAFDVFGDDEFEVEDSNNLTFNASPQIFYDNLGGLGVGTLSVVTSNNRHEYPDSGVQGAHFYKLRPQDTKFIEYTNEKNILLNVELFKDRYNYPHENTYFNRDTSLYNTVIGTEYSTNEGSIPDASWREYEGVYLGESIPFLGILEDNIPASLILGVPQYDKQINTNDTLKYGTVAAASLVFTLNLPVQEAMAYNNAYLILYYDFEHNDNWHQMGFFYIDSIEAIDEYTSRITAHDEVYKLNVYCDDFLTTAPQNITINDFYHSLLDFCGCYYDSHEIIHNQYMLNNVYKAVRTTGIEVAHYIATLEPGFIHANYDGDVVLQRYHQTNSVVTIGEYTNLTYTAYNSDIVNKVKITTNNKVIGEDSGEGENVYYVSDNPLVNTMETTATLNNLATTILNGFNLVPPYRPAELTFLVLPPFEIGDIATVVTPTNEQYYFLAMKVSVSANGLTVQSLGTQKYPVENSNNSQFTNLYNDISTVNADVADLDETTQEIGQALNETSEDVRALTLSMISATGSINSLNATVASLSTRMGTAEENITTTASTVSSLQTQLANTDSALQAKINNDNVSSTTNFATVKINGSTVDNIARKAYVDDLAGTGISMKTGTLIYTTESGGSQYSCAVMFIGNPTRTTGIFVPIGNYEYVGSTTNQILMFRLDNSTLYGLLAVNGTNTVKNFWQAQYSYSVVWNS